MTSYDTAASQRLFLTRVTLDDIIRYCGQSTSVPDQNTLIETGAGWTTDQFAGLTLIPNIVHTDSIYTIQGNTSDTITTVQPMDMGKIQVGRDFKVVGIKTGDKPVKFFSNTGTNSFADGDTTYDGICEVCHTLTDHFRNDGTGPDQDHTSQGPSVPGTNCTACHSHVEGFKGAGDCVDCHGTSGPGINVQSEFGTAITDTTSHHISKAWADMAGEDCVACHAEGDPNGDGTASQSALHPGGSADGTVEMIDNSDPTRTTVISIELARVESKDNSLGDVDDLVDFCFGCHRAGGSAAIIAANGFDVNHTSTNPFGETTNIRTNQYDQVQKNFTADGGGLAVYESFDTAESGEPDGDGNRESHHAVRGARYTTSILGTNGFLDTTLVLWDSSTLDDDSVMFCTDCHSVAFSAHGGNNEYMLQAWNSGTTTPIENPTAVHSDYTEYVCSKCHDEATGNYASGGNSNHTSKESNMVHTAGQIGPANRLNGEGHITGIACLNCHDGNVGFGGIHGFSDAQYTAGEGGSGQGTYNKRRFLPGSGLAYYDPSDTTNGDAAWEMTPGSSDNQCYTLGTGTSISECTHHDKGTGLDFRNIQRNVDY
jgi:hypothetical protein